MHESQQEQPSPDTEHEFELKKQELTLRKTEHDEKVRLENARLELERARLEIDKLEAKRSISTKAATLLAAATTILGTVLGAIGNSYFAGLNSLELEKKKMESSLIVETLKTKDEEQIKRQLRLLVYLGFLEDENGRILNLGDVPSLLPRELDGDEQFLDNANGDTYCAEKFGPSFSMPNQVPPRCTDGRTVHEVDISEICEAQHQSKIYRTDPVRILYTCKPE